MHTILITFDLVNMTSERYAEVSAELAPSFTTVPGLLTKIWLSDSNQGRRGGLYLFDDDVSADRYLNSALARMVAQNPHFGDLTVQSFVVDETTTAVTQPKIKVVPAIDPGWPQEGW